MPKFLSYNAVVVGAGPNGLAAAITVARTGRSVLLVEAKSTIGGGMRTAEITLPGFRHDICSAILPLGLASPFISSLPLDEYGLTWIHPDIPLAHPLDDGTAVILDRTFDVTEKSIGTDGEIWRKFMQPLTADWAALAPALLSPLPVAPQLFALARFGLPSLLPASMLARFLFREERAKALFGGIAAHAIMPLDKVFSAAAGIILGTVAHAVGWPLPSGGSQQLANAMAAYFVSLGGEIVTDWEVTNICELPRSDFVFLDVTPRQLIKLAGHCLPSRYQQQLSRYRYGPGVFKVDYALAGPMPWRAPDCQLAGTVHIGGTLAEIVASEKQVGQGIHPKRPFVLVTQQSMFDITRAPAGQHSMSAYCHVPNGSQVDMTTTIECQLQRFAPGFMDLILARHTHNTTDLARYNPNYIGGDINGGVQDIFQMWTRPVPRLNPYATPVKGLFICSSSTPPGGGVHGMCGYHAAQSALREVAS